MNKLTLSEYFKALRVKIALKVVLAGIICILINNIFHFHLLYFSLLFVLLILVLYHGDVLKAGSITIVGCIVSGVVSLVITYLLFDSKVIYVLLLSVWIFFVVAILVKHFLAMLISGVAATMVMYNSIYNSISYSTSLFEYYVVQLILAVVVCYIIDELVWPNRSRAGPNLDINSALTRFLALFSAVLIGLIVQHVLWPTNPLKILKEKISKSIDFSGRIINKLVTLDINDPHKIDDIVLPLAASLPTSTSLLHDAEYIIREDELHAEQFIKIIESIELIYADLETLKRIINEGIDNPLINSFLNVMKDDYSKSCRLFEEVSHQFAKRECYSEEIAKLTEEIGKRVTQYRESGEWRSYTPEEIEKLVLIETSIKSLLESLDNISKAISEINQTNISESSILVAKEA